MGDDYRQLRVEERVNIMLRLRDGMSSRAIARNAICGCVEGRMNKSTTYEGRVTAERRAGPSATYLHPETLEERKPEKFPVASSC